MKNSATDKPNSHHQSSYETFNEPLMNFHFVPVNVLFCFFFYTNCFFLYPIIQITYISYSFIFFLFKITQYFCFIFFDSFSLNLLAIYVQNNRIFNHLCCDNNYNITMIAFKTFFCVYFHLFYFYNFIIFQKHVCSGFGLNFKFLSGFFVPVIKNESKIYD